jgi:cell wall-associated NlpC family hydrolase
METTGNRRFRALIIVGTLFLFSLMTGCGGPATVDRPSEKPAERPAAPKNTGKAAVKMAQDFIGAPYRSGGTTTNGVDCSGLTFAVYRQLGVKLPRTSAAQARSGNHIDQGDLQAGDLVFFRIGSSINHVGIYADDGEFIHASTRARGVRFDRLDNKYFRNRYVGARRVV